MIEQKISAVIFDMDGTLIDSEPLWHEAEITVLGSKGFAITRDDCLEMVGRRIDSVVAAWQERFTWPVEQNPHVVNDIIDEVSMLIKERGAAKEGAYDLLHFLSELEMPMAIASSSPLRLINTVVEKLELRSFLQVVHSAEHEEQGKPHPAVFLNTARKLAVEPENCLVFEDSLAGIGGAKAAGMTCVAVKESATPFDEAQRLADYSLSSLRDFMQSEILALVNK